MNFKNKVFTGFGAVTMIFSMLVLQIPVNAFSANDELNYFRGGRMALNHEEIFVGKSNFKKYRNFNYSLRGFSKNNVKLEIKEESKILGSVEVQNDARSIKTSFVTTGGERLAVEIFRSPLGAAKEEGKFISLSFKNQKAVLTLAQLKGSQPTSESTKRRMQTLISAVQNTKDLAHLLNASQNLDLGDPAYQCVMMVVGCLAAVITWVGAMAALVATCPLSFGWTCLGALIAHPVISAGVGFACGEAGRNCEQEKKPAMVETAN